MQKNDHFSKNNLLLSIGLFFFNAVVFAQKPITVDPPTTTLDFGTFWTQTGGDITINTDGSQPKIDAGIIHLLPPSSTPILFNVYASKNNNIDITVDTIIINPTDCTLSVFFDPTSPFTNTNSSSTPTVVRMGGTLTVPPNPLPGLKQGTVKVTFTYNFN